MGALRLAAGPLVEFEPNSSPVLTVSVRSVWGLGLRLFRARRFLNASALVNASYVWETELQVLNAFD